MSGVVLAGWVVYLVLAHWSYSQAYFLRLANPVALVFAVWALAAAIPSKAGGRRVAAVLAGGTLLGTGVVALCRAVTPSLSGRMNSLPVVATSFVVPLAVLCVVVVVGLITWVVARRKVPGLRGWGSGLVLAALVLGGPAQGAIAGSSHDLIAFVGDTAVPVGGGYRLSPGAAAVMAWVNQRTPNDAVVATNRHCVTGPTRPSCLSLAFWVSGLGGRRTVLEGWGYTSAAKWATAPSPFPERLAVNDAVFTNPSVDAIDKLRQGYGVSWLVADTSAGPVSSALAQFAVPRFSSGEVTVYQLR